MLIGEDIVNAAFDAWFIKHNFKTRINGLDNEFFWNFDTDKVSYCFVHSDRFIEDFTEVCNDLGLQYDIDIFWLSFFHEVGHGQTFQDITDDEIWEADFLSGFDYYYCQREVVATQWAVDFINNHFDLVIDLIEMVKPAIVKFFQDNNIEED
jgi:hypothetical protein